MEECCLLACLLMWLSYTAQNLLLRTRCWPHHRGHRDTPLLTCVPTDNLPLAVPWYSIRVNNKSTGLLLNTVGATQQRLSGRIFPYLDILIVICSQRTYVICVRACVHVCVAVWCMFRYLWRPEECVICSVVGVTGGCEPPKVGIYILASLR